MQRSFLTKLLVAAAALALACTSDRSPLPTQPQPPAYSTSSFPGCDVPRIAQLVKALFPPGSKGDLAQRGISAIQSSLGPGKTAIAQAAMFAFVKATLADLAAGTLLLPSPTIAPSTSAAVSELFALLYQCVGLTPLGDISAALSPGGAAAVVAPTDPPTTITTGGDHPAAGVSIGTGAISTTQTVLVTIAPDPAGTNPFPNTAGLQTFPPFYEFRTTPDVALFNKPVLAGICVDLTNVPPVQAQRLQLAHADRRTNSTTLQILGREDAGFLPCNSFVTPGSGLVRAVPAERKGFLGRLAERAVALLRPQPLHAATLLFPGGLGGLTSNFTDFRAVDPGQLVFTQQPTNTLAGAFITPAVKVTLTKQDGITTITPTTADSVTVAILTGTGTASATLSGAKQVPLVGGVATFGDLSIDQPGTGYQLTASGTSPTGALPASATSVAFDITGKLLFGSSSAGSGSDNVIEPHPGSLFAINTASGQATLIGSTNINGGRGVPEVSAIAFDPTTGTLYGVTGSACSDAKLITINTSTGAGTLVGSLVGTGFNPAGGTGTSNCVGGSDALAFSSDGTLYASGWRGGNPGGSLLKVDKSTGAVLAVFPTTGAINFAGLAFSPAGGLWASRGNNGAGRIHTIDPTNGQTLSTVQLKTAAGADDNAIVSDLAFSPQGTLYASLPEENELARIDPNTGLLTRIGSFGIDVRKMSGLTFRP